MALSASSSRSSKGPRGAPKTAHAEETSPRVIRLEADCLAQRDKVLAESCCICLQRESSANALAATAGVAAAIVVCSTCGACAHDTCLGPAYCTPLQPAAESGSTEAAISPRERRRAGRGVTAASAAAVTPAVQGALLRDFQCDACKVVAAAKPQNNTSNSDGDAKGGDGVALAASALRAAQRCALCGSSAGLLEFAQADSSALLAHRGCLLYSGIHTPAASLTPACSLRKQMRLQQALLLADCRSFLCCICGRGSSSKGAPGGYAAACSFPGCKLRLHATCAFSLGGSTQQRLLVPVQQKLKQEDCEHVVQTAAPDTPCPASSYDCCSSNSSETESLNSATSGGGTALYIADGDFALQPQAHKLQPSQQAVYIWRGLLCPQHAHAGAAAAARDAAVQRLCGAAQRRLAAAVAAALAEEEQPVASTRESVLQGSSRLRMAVVET
ncbi:hypothetical protein cyc_06123 [Cyclospora cayetanensis]|uniref:Uncharacterized protein n=1 Tax=Cyclospora cayetanensis TaxID=88456 RepID=A0A1D3D451_9EIME|nr:hypothetical protein cyc_06123 [Cyclospora cayetanensis]